MDAFDWDEGNWPKCGKHGVSKEEIEFVFTNTPLVKADRTPQDTETRYNAIGQNQKGRYIFLAFTLREQNGYRRLYKRYIFDELLGTSSAKG